MKNVLFVCTGNTCRSPMVEGLFRKAVAGRNDYEVGSAGVAVASNGGAPCNPETAALLTKKGAMLLDDEFTSRQVTEAMLASATHVFAMTHDHLQTLKARFPHHYAEKFYLVGAFVGNIPSSCDDGGIGTDVPDPIGLGRRAYEKVAEMFDLAIPTIIAYIDQTCKNDQH